MIILSKKRIIIIGGGVGGLELATSLGRKLGRNKSADIILVDKNHNYLWKPRLHEAATGSFDEDLNAVNYMAHAYSHFFQFQRGCMINIDRKRKRVLLDEIYDNHKTLLVPARWLSYDILVIALGSISNDFSIPGVKEHCIFLDNIQEAKRFRNEILNLFLKFSTQNNPEKKINITIVGGGATGVELSAELHNAVQKLQNYGFKGLKSQDLNVTLIEAGQRILPALPLRISTSAHQELSKLGVNVLINTIVTNVNARGVHTKNGEYIEANLIVWAAGIKAPDVMKNLDDLEINHINQLVVKNTLQTTRDPHIFAIGDCTSCTSSTGNVVPPRAQAAHQMAFHVYKNILALFYNRMLRSYIYKDYGSLVSLSCFKTTGILMSNFIPFPIMIEGRIARSFYIFLYRIHQITLHGYIKTSLIVLVDIINKIIRPYFKLY